MNFHDVASRRLFNQLLLKAKTKTPSEVVARIGAVQAQDYEGGELSIGLRLLGSAKTDIDEAIAAGKVIRTWGLRGTLHFLSAEDIDWILGLLAPLLISRLKRRYNELGLDARTFRKTNSLLERSLKGNRHLTRSELVAIIEKNGISCRGQRAVFILHRASLERVICFGIRRGKEQTHALFEEWVPKRKAIDREASLAELAGRYFASHGPATIQDYMWWSGLRTADANAGLDMIRSDLERATMAGKTYWMPGSTTSRASTGTVVHLLPSFDDFLIGYKDRIASISTADSTRLRTGGMPNQVIIINGCVIGTWTRTLKRQGTLVEATLFRRLRTSEMDGLEAAAKRYGNFIGQTATLKTSHL